VSGPRCLIDSILVLVVALVDDDRRRSQSSAIHRIDILGSPARNWTANHCINILTVVMYIRSIPYHRHVSRYVDLEGNLNFKKRGTGFAIHAWSIPTIFRVPLYRMPRYKSSPHHGDGDLSFPPRYWRDKSESLLDDRWSGSYGDRQADQRALLLPGTIPTRDKASTSPALPVSEVRSERRPTSVHSVPRFVSFSISPPVTDDHFDNLRDFDRNVILPGVGTLNLGRSYDSTHLTNERIRSANIGGHGKRVP